MSRRQQIKQIQKITGDSLSDCRSALKAIERLERLENANDLQQLKAIIAELVLDSCTFTGGDIQVLRNTLNEG